MTPWIHQPRTVNEVLQAVQRDERRICVTGPTGSGKTWIMQVLAQDYLEREKKVILYSNRRMLIDQISRGLIECGMYHGVRAAGYADEREHPFQVSSIATEHSRVHRKNVWGLHDADLVIIDEAHIQCGDTAKRIIDAHYEAGAAIVGFTATPLDIGHIYTHLVVAAVTSECRACGALVPCHTFGPDEPDFRAFKEAQAALNAGKNPSEKQVRKAIMVPGIFGRVWEWFDRLNPDHKPTLLFAPGVAESIWFAERFAEKGVSSAHIDGEHIWRNGVLQRSSREAREELIHDSRVGRVCVVCNRFVLREGIDMPWLAHGILATVFGSLQSYIQAGGRLLRAFPGLESVAIQDHGGNWHRFGSLNADREWDLNYTASMVTGMRQDRIRQHKIAEPFRCPQCGRIWTTGTKCQQAHGGCGYELENRKRSRPVVGTDGELKELTGSIYKPHRVCQKPDGPKLWEKMYWRSRTEKGSRTFRAAFALFAQENNWAWPDLRWPLMPTVEHDHYLLVKDVPMERLTQATVSTEAG